MSSQTTSSRGGSNIAAEQKETAMLSMLEKALKGVSWVNQLVAKIGASIAWVLVALMVASILLQVFFRYILNDALPWPEEVARALMIWMMALVASSAYRSGSFVAIEMLHDYLPDKVRHGLKLLLALIAMVVLFRLTQLGIDFFERGFRTRAASFHLPRAWIYLAMPVCFGTMFVVSIELVLAEFLGLFNRGPNCVKDDAC